MEGPTLASEFRRGLNAYNLTVGALSALAVGFITWLGTRSGWIPDLLDRGPLWQGIVTAVGFFILTTAMHTAVHAYFGYRFGRGIAASHEGRHALAVSLLSPVERGGLSHYDDGGHAARALQASREALPKK